MKRFLENPAIVGAAAIVGAIGIVAGAALLTWDIADQRERDTRIEEKLGSIDETLESIGSGVNSANHTLDTGVKNATAARKALADDLDRRVDNLENDHKWFFQARANADTVPSDATVIRQLEAALGRAMIAAKDNLDRAERAEAQLKEKSE